MKKHLLQSLLAVALLLVCGNVWGESYQELFSVTSDDVVTNSNYSTYETKIDSREWIITFGGNNKSVGTNSKNRSNCKLSSSNSKYAVSPVTTSDIASAFVSKTKIEDVSKISYTFEGGSNQTSTNVYLIYSANGTTFSQMTLESGTQGATISSGTAYEFTKCSGYFGLLFESTNTSDNWRIDDVNVTFYKTASDATKYNVIVNDSENGSVTADPAQAAENDEVTLTISPAEHYQLSTLTVTDANERTIDVSGDYTFTMPACDVTVSATFELKDQFDVTYMSLGNQVGTEIVYDGEFCANVPSVTNTPEGWSFAGWTTQSSYAMSTTAPAMFSATTPVTADVTLYAVFRKQTGETPIEWNKVNDASTLEGGDIITLVATASGSKVEVHNGTFASAAFGEKSFFNAVNATLFDGRLVSDGFIEITLGGDATGWTLTTSEGQVGTEEPKKMILGTDTEWTISISEGLATITAGTCGKILYNREYPRFLNYDSESNASMVLPSIYRKENGVVYTYTTTTPQAQDITISSVGWATASVPFTATVSGATAYTAKVEDGALVMTPITVIPAGAGVLLESVNGGATTATFTESGLEGEDVTDNQLRGNATNASVTWGNEEGATAIFTYYIFANDAEYGLGFYWQKGTGGSSVSCGAYKAALVVPGAPTTEPAAIGYRLDGTTMVEQLLQESSDAAIYDLQGRKVENATKGLYIVGGKKVMVK